MGQILDWCGRACWLLAALATATLAGAALADEAPRRDALLYEVRAPGGQNPSYLFGTIHSEDPRILDLPGPVLTAFADSPAFALEVVPDTEAIIKSMVTMTYTDGRTLREVLPADLYPEVAAALQGLGMPPAAFRDFKPWAVLTLISVPPAGSGEFLDMRLYRTAKDAGKRILGLESMEEQLAVFDDMNESDQIALLREALGSRDELPAMFESLIEAYLARNLDTLMERSEHYLQGTDPRLSALFREAAVESRNRRMAQRMLPLFDQGGWFIAVGALHLPGVNGILNLLEQKGYRVTPVH
ncbi:MAG: TraB/GumN family protein [Chromatiaceae bacterium]